MGVSDNGEVASLTLAAVPMEDIGASILLNIGKEGRYKGQYVFGLPECLGRVNLEHKPKAGFKTTALFTLSNCSQGVGGLGSQILDLQRLGVGKVCLYGAKGIGNHVQGLYELFKWKYPDLQCFEVNGSQSGGVVFSDEFIDVMVLGQGLRGGILDSWIQQHKLTHDINNSDNTTSSSEYDTSSSSEEETSDSNSEESNPSQQKCCIVEESDCQHQNEQNSSQQTLNNGCCNQKEMQGPVNTQQLQGQLNTNGQQVECQVEQTDSIQQNSRTKIEKKEENDQTESGHIEDIKNQQASQEKEQNINNTQSGLKNKISETGSSEVHGQNGGNEKVMDSNHLYKNINQQILLDNNLNGFYGYVCRLKFCGKIVLFVNFCSIQDLNQFKQGQIFLKLQRYENIIAGIVHLSSATVCENSQYIKLCREFPGKQFILNNQEICETRTALQSSLRSIIRFNCLLPNQFQIPYHQISGGCQKLQKGVIIFDSKIQQCGLMVQLKISGGGNKIMVDRESSVLDVDAGEVRKELVDSKPNLPNMSIFKEIVKQLVQSQGDSNNQVENSDPIEKQKQESQEYQKNHKDGNRVALDKLVQRLKGKTENPEKDGIQDDEVKLSEKEQSRGESNDNNTANQNTLKRKLGETSDNPYEEDDEEEGQKIAKRKKFIQSFSEKDKLQESLSQSNDTEILFLGTGCSTPSKYRGPSAILLRFSDSSGILLDAGEGTWTSLTRHFGGIDGASTFLNCMLCIWISHKHWDHVAGLPKLLEKRDDQNPLVVVAPPPVQSWMKITYPHLYQTHRFVLNLNFKTEHLNSVKEIPLKGMQSVPVIHCHDSYAAIVSLTNGQKIVYSGDTRPCERLIRCGQNCDLLIHEATFEDELLDHAINKGHSTILEAVRVSKKMQAKACILTHFSQRYCNMPINVVEQEGGCFGVAFDGMRICMGDLKNLPAYARLTNFVCEVDDDTGEEKEHRVFEGNQ